MTNLPTPSPYAATAVTAPDGSLVDVRLTVTGRIWHLAGRGGAAAERERAMTALAAGGLPVFLGAGLGAGLHAAAAAGSGPIFVLDREAAIEAVTGVRAELAGRPNIRFLDDPDPERAAAVVADAARQAGFSGLTLIAHPVYARLDPAWYGTAAAALRGYTALRQRLIVPRLRTDPPRVLVLHRPYFLYREIEAALTRLGIAHTRVAAGARETGEEQVVAELLSTVASFRPDMVLTVNHLGLDREGRLTKLLADLGLPLASWFVDSPRLILHEYAAVASPVAMIFSYDADTLPELTALGFAHTAWLPLATDPDRFAPPEASAATNHPWRAQASFVGASMVPQAKEAQDKLARFPVLVRELPRLAQAFVGSPEKSARAFLAADPICGPILAGLPSAEDRLHAEQALTWEATRRYRHACVRALLPFTPLVAGDEKYWRQVLPGAGRDWRPLGPLDYYDDLPGFYPQSDVNLNCTSLQMKGAVNQRVFDAPATGAFVLTDTREQLGELFALGREVVAYSDPGEIPELVRHYLDHPDERRRIAAAGRARVLAEHTYDQRLARLLAAMKKAFGR